MKKINLILLPLCLSISAICQDYYVSVNNDTIHGVIVNYKEWSKNPVVILFKTTSPGNTIELTPTICKSVVIGNSDKYVSYSGMRILNTDDITSKAGLNNNEKLQKDSVSIFLREIYQYKGYTLYKLFDNKRINFFLEKKGVLKELEYYEYINEASQVVSFDAYKKYILEELAEERVTGIEQKIDKLSYKEEQLIDFFASILKDKPHASEKFRNKYPTEVILGAGLYENLSVISNEAVSIAGSYHHTGIVPSLEVGLRVYSQRNFGKLFFQPVINFTSISDQFKIDNGAEYKTKATILSGHLSAGYFFSKKPTLSFYGVVGAGMTVIFNYGTTLINGSYSEENKEKNVINRLTIHPELGIVLHKSFNIGIVGTVPFKLPFYSNGYTYKVGQVGIIVRYVF